MAPSTPRRPPSAWKFTLIIASNALRSICRVCTAAASSGAGAAPGARIEVCRVGVAPSMPSSSASHGSRTRG
eukprot:CAMPEP_0195147812 /NCGR_PEP_ID=MMETSP0448-20130528/174098_1 /TAXON_ID=66468 /ORGANISM="Heterocapsa triquestra, Strain CCMP 448" /LENGTH=71 /DNA_ID=CAMNT_0040186403 /DNA_START=184 /DNA_END=395 /DNA_ORIENTATION=+